MTAEIAILNKHGVAMAADSKVTIGSSGQEKTFDTVNKLFTLSKIHPVGVMIFGNAEFMRYPWETIVKTYRQQKADAAENTIEDWGKDFLKYLSSFGNIRPEDKTSNTRAIINSILEELQDKVYAEARRQNISIPSKDHVNLLSKRVQHEIDRLGLLDDFFSQAQKTTFIDECGLAVGEAVNEHFEPFEDKALTEKAVELAILSVFKREFSPLSSGFVISGFGTREYFPALVSCETDGYVGGVLKVIQDQTTEITRDMPSTIRPFAQKDMVMRFMNGIDPSIMFGLRRVFTGTLIRSCLDVLEKYGDPAKQTDEIKLAIGDAARAAIETVGTLVNKIQMDNFSRPIMQMVSLLPKDELPHLAESLVALTSLKRHVSRDAETVGGPIDVCLISKGDGFIWIKRKHYFRQELNPQFTLNYMRGISQSGGANEKRGTRRVTRPARSGAKKEPPPEPIPQTSDG